MALRGSTNAEKIWNYFLDKGISKCGVAGIIGNLDCESALSPTNLEDMYQSKLGFTDDSYTAAVDNGSYSNFVNDCAGYGLAQFTWWTRKRDLLALAKSRGVSIGDLEMQLDFIWSELNGSFSPVLSSLKNASSVYDASTAFLLRYEAPADQSASMRTRRANYCQKYYDRFVTNKQVSASTEFKCSLSPIDGYYRFRKKSHIQLEKNFSSDEFDCHGSGCCSETIINANLVKHCQQIRDHFGTSMSISSPYRCAKRNGSTPNAATNSRHTKGDAADIVVAGHAPREVAAYAESIGILGIGLYETSSDGYFVHIDERDYKSFWYGQACSPRTTFGGSTVVQSVQPQTSSSSGVMSSGSKGENVIELQNNLIKLGYDVGACGADGEYGYGTMTAVRKFQQDNGLRADGIAGSATLQKLNDSASKIQKSQEDEVNDYIVTANLLNIRSGAGTNNSIVGQANKNTILSIKKVENGWGLTENGWVSMQYLQRKG